MGCDPHGMASGFMPVQLHDGASPQCVPEGQYHGTSWLHEPTAVGTSRPARRAALARTAETGSHSDVAAQRKHICSK
jgi:hypothetical protein